MSALPAGDRRAVEHFAVFEKLRIQRVRGNRYVLLLADGIREPEVHELHFLFFDEAENVSAGRHEYSSGRRRV